MIRDRKVYYMQRGDKRKAFIYIFLLLISALILFVTHRLVPFMLDDLWYSTVLYDETPIKSFSDIIAAQVWHYNNWGGRSITHGLLQIILMCGENIADILNVLTTFILAWMICVLSDNKTGFAFFAAIGMLHGLNANWKMSMFWQSGAANYLYITVFILLYLFCYLRELSEENTDLKEMGKSLPGIVLWIIPLGLIAGWSNENMGPAVWLISTVVIVLKYREKEKLPIWMLLGNLACLIGSVLVIIAPGNFVRSAEVPEQQYGMLWRCFLRGYAESKAFLEFLFPTILLLFFVLILYKVVLKEKIGKKNSLLLLGAMLSWLAMALSPHYPDRATFGTMVLLICVILSLIRKIIQCRKDLEWLLFGIMFFIWLRGMYFCGEFAAISWGWIR